MSGGTYLPHGGCNAADVRDFFVVFTTASNGTSDVTPTSAGGYKVTSITGPTTNSATGKYIVTLAEQCQAVLGCTATVDENLGSVVDGTATCAPVDASANPLQIGVILKSGGSASNLTSTVVRLRLALRMSSVA